jgi:hypothetical protein
MTVRISMSGRTAGCIGSIERISSSNRSTVRREPFSDKF